MSLGSVGSPMLNQQVAEEFPVLRVAYSIQGSAQETDIVLFQHTGVGEGHGQVEARLPAQGGKDALGPLPLDDPSDDVHRQGFNVDDVGYALVGHYGGRIGVDQHCGDALLLEGLASLCARIVELRRLPYDNRA